MKQAMRKGWMAVGAGLLAACGGDRVEELPPLQRPSLEQRAGLPELRGRWLFAGWEVSPRDTGRITEKVYPMVAPGEIRVLTQRMDSVAGQYGVPGEFVLPFTGEVRHDGVMAAVVTGGDGVGQFLSGRVVRDTLWLELSTLGVSATWPPRTRVAYARRLRTTPFMRLLGGRPLGPNAAVLDSLRRDSVRRDSIARAALPQPVPVGPVTPGQPVPAQPVPTQPRPRPRPRDTLIAPPSGPARIDTQRPPPARIEPRDTPPEVRPDAPRDTLRIGNPP